MGQTSQNVGLYGVDISIVPRYYPLQKYEFHIVHLLFRVVEVHRTCETTATPGVESKVIRRWKVPA